MTRGLLALLAAAVLVVTVPGDDRARARATPGPSADPAAQSAVETVKSFVALVGGESADLTSACALLSRGTRLALSGYWACPDGLAFLLFYEEEDIHPDLVSMRARKVAVHKGRPTIASIHLVYRFAPDNRYDLRRLTVRATVALVREEAGWRISVPDALSPRAAVLGESALSRAELRERLADYQSARREVRARRRDERLATRDARIGPTSCPGVERSFEDPVGDLLLADQGSPGDPQHEPHADLSGVAHSRELDSVCFSLRFHEPVPPQLFLEFRLGQRASSSPRVPRDEYVTVIVDQARTVAYKDVTNPRYFPAKVSLSPARDAVRLRMRAIRGWPSIDTRRRYWWSVNATVAAPAFDNAYMDDIPENQQAGQGLPSP